MIENHVLDGPHGPLPVRVHRPDVRPSGVGLVWVHGGSFVGGDLDMPESEQVARRLSIGGIAVVTVDYQRAPLPGWWADELGIAARPGVHAPVPQDEVAHAYRWACRSECAAPAATWSLGGASAGASLAASAALGLRTDAVPPRSLVLAYPTVHAELPDLGVELAAIMPSVPAARRFLPDQVLAMNENHLGRPVADDRSTAFAGGQELSELPPVLILNSEYDDLRASGEAFARELTAAGVDVTCLYEPDTLHGHLNDEGDEKASRSIQRIEHWLLQHG